MTGRSSSSKDGGYEFVVGNDMRPLRDPPVLPLSPGSLFEGDDGVSATTSSARTILKGMGPDHPEQAPEPLFQPLLTTGDPDMVRKTPVVEASGTVSTAPADGPMVGTPPLPWVVHPPRGRPPLSPRSSPGEERYAPVLLLMESPAARAAARTPNASPSTSPRPPAASAAYVARKDVDAQLAALQADFNERRRADEYTAAMLARDATARVAQADAQSQAPHL